MDSSVWARSEGVITLYRNKVDLDKTVDPAGSIERGRDVEFVVQKIQPDLYEAKYQFTDPLDHLAFNFRIFPSEDIEIYTYWFYTEGDSGSERHYIHTGIGEDLDDLPSTTGKNFGFDLKVGKVIQIFRDSVHALPLVGFSKNYPLTLQINFKRKGRDDEFSLPMNAPHLLYTGVELSKSEYDRRVNGCSYQDVSIVPSELYKLSLTSNYNKWSFEVPENLCFSEMVMRSADTLLPPRCRIKVTARLSRAFRLDRADHDRIHPTDFERKSRCYSRVDADEPIREMDELPSEYQVLFDETGLSLANKTIVDLPSIFPNSMNKNVGFWSVGQIHNPDVARQQNKNIAVPAVRGITEITVEYTPDPDFSLANSGKISLFVNAAVCYGFGNAAKNSAEKQGLCYYIPYWIEQNPFNSFRNIEESEYMKEFNAKTNPAARRENVEKYLKGERSPAHSPFIPSEFWFAGCRRNTEQTEQAQNGNESDVNPLSSLDKLKSRPMNQNCPYYKALQEKKKHMSSSEVGVGYNSSTPLPPAASTAIPTQPTRSTETNSVQTVVFREYPSAPPRSSIVSFMNFWW